MFVYGSLLSGAQNESAFAHLDLFLLMAWTAII